MPNVRIGPDGSIIKDDVVVESEGRTIIREDGTIETTNVARSAPVSNHSPMILTPPVSPLEGTGSHSDRTSPQVTNPVSYAQPATQTSINVKAIAEKEYDIQIQESKIRGAFPRNMIIATAILCVLGLMGLYFLYIPAILTGIMIVVRMIKKSKLEAEKKRMYIELDNLRNGIRQ